MTEITEEKQISIRIKDYLVARLDKLAANGSVNRHHLMLTLVNLWLGVLKTPNTSRLFYVSCLLRVHEGIYIEKLDRYRLGFNESGIPEKSLPIKLSRDDRFVITGHAMRSHISSHNMLKVMVIVGLEVLEELTTDKPYRIEEVEQRLSKQFNSILKKGNRAMEAYQK